MFIRHSTQLVIDFFNQYFGVSKSWKIQNSLNDGAHSQTTNYVCGVHFPEIRAKIIREAEVEWGGGDNKERRRHVVCEHKFDLANSKQGSTLYGGKAQTTAAGLRDCNRRGALELVSGSEDLRPSGKN